MLVSSIAHAKLVLKRFQESGLKYFVTDTETEAKPEYSYDSEAALIYNRAQVKLIVFSFNGESYGFATDKLSKKFPTAREYGDLLRSIWEDPEIVKVVHNWIYDSWVFDTELDLPFPKNFWCTMTSSWMAAEYLPKSLKERCLRYGRILRETKKVDFSDLSELSEYGEDDGLSTEELFLAHTKGKVVRNAVREINSNGLLVLRRSSLPLGPVPIPEDEKLTEDKKKWLLMVEFPIIAATVRAQKRGFPIDVEKLREIRKQILADRDAALKTIYSVAGRVFNVGSRQQIAKIAEELGIENTNKTRSGAMSFGAKARSKLKASSGHAFIEALDSLKSLDKLMSSYVGPNIFDVERITDPKNLNSGYEYFINPSTGCIHSTVNTVGAITGRATSDNPNLQQVPTRKDKYGIKSAFVGTPNHPDLLFIRKPKKKLLIVLDYSQLEIRVMCLLSRDPEMTRILSDPQGDIHNNTRDKFSVSRDSAKNLNFLLLYGGEDFMLSETLTQFGAPTTLAQAAAYRQIYCEVHHGVVSYRKQLLLDHQQQGFIRLWCNRRRHIDNIDWNEKYSVHKAETTLSNNVVQGSGQDFLKASVVRLNVGSVNPDAAALEVYGGDKKHRAIIADYSRKLSKFRRTLQLGDCRYLLQVHDELAFSVLPEAAEECLNICSEVMSWRHYVPAIHDYNIPLVAEGGVGYDWKHAKGKDPLFKAKHGL